jgi:hypothetical protein
MRLTPAQIAVRLICGYFCGAGSLYDSDFCGSISFADRWEHPACELDLPLIRAIDDPVTPGDPAGQTF